jgi:acetyl esterase/lipase
LNLPTVLYVFGGGFKTGSRDHEYLMPFFRQLTGGGYRVVAIDYRLGLKDVTKMGVSQRDLLKKAIDMAVEDLYSATAFLLANPEATGVDPAKIVLCGSSAGAITVLQADWERCNGAAVAAALPADFAFAGVVSFAGAIYSNQGKPRYRNAKPAPTLLFHGIDDKIVTYKKISFFSLCFAGSDALFPVLEKSGVPCAIYRFKGIGHEVAGSMERNYSLMDRFIRADVVGEKPFVEDAILTDSAIEPWKLKSLDDIYSTPDPKL